MRSIALLLALLAGTGEARAQAFFGTNPPANGASSTIATGSTTGRSLADRAADVVNVKDYGAVCDDTADDTAAINAAFAVVRARNTGPALMYSEVVFPTAKACKITGTINWTSLRGRSITINGAGSTIDCQVPGGICIDGLGSRWLKVRDLTLIGAGATPPTIGIQIGRTNIDSIDSSDNHTFDNVFITGTFSLASFYNFTSETAEFNHVYFWNSSASATAYTLIQDGFNHFNAQSAFVTESAPVDTGESFNENVFINCDFRNFGTGPTIWMGGTSRHRFISSYSATIGANVGIVLYGEGSANNSMLDIDMHFETTALTNVFLVSGTNTAPLLNGFRYRDHNTYASNAVFKTDTGILSVNMRDADIQIGNYNNGAAHLFDTASLWTVTGHYFSPSMTQFNPPLTWEGRLTVGQQERLAYYGTGVALSMQIPDSTAVGGNARGNQAVDMQMLRAANSQVASGNGSTIIGGSNNNATGFASVSGGTTNRAQGTSSVALGEANDIFGNWSASPGGKGAADRTRLGANCYSSGHFTAHGDAQTCQSTLHGTGASASAIRLTADAGAATAFNCMNIPDSTAYSVFLTITAFDHTTVTKNELWPVWGGLLTRGAGVGTTALTMNATPTPITNGTLTGSAIAVTADTTNGCLNISFTPPTANTDTWNAVARVETVEVQ